MSVKALKLGIIMMMVAVVLTQTCSNDSPNEPTTTAPKAAFDTEFTDNIIPATVHFINKSEKTTSYNWDFGDGSSSTDENPSHIYEVAGNYHVKLVALGDEGKDSTTQIITIIEPPVEIFLGKGAAGVNRGEPLSKAIDLYGNDYHEDIQSGSGNYTWTITYKARGLQFRTFRTLGEDSKLKAKIQWILLMAPYKGITDKGIGIGSARADVEKFYPGTYFSGSGGPDWYMTEGNIFRFSGDNVFWIQIGL